MADAKRCDVCGTFSAEAEPMQSHGHPGDIDEYDGWWSVESLSWTPGANSRRRLHSLDICSRQCLSLFADKAYRH